MDYLNFSMQCNGILDFNGLLVKKRKNRQEKKKEKNKQELFSLLSMIMASEQKSVFLGHW